MRQGSLDRTALSDTSSLLLSQLSFLNFTGCVGNTPGGGNRDYRESVTGRPSKGNQDGG